MIYINGVLKKNQRVILVLGLFVLALVLVSVLLLWNGGTKEPFEEDFSPLVIVVSRYNENLEWLKEEPFSRYPVLIYNKGVNDDFYHPPNLRAVIPVENVGRCDHTYLYYIVQQYDDLDSITVFLPGSANLEHKIHKSRRMIQEIEARQSAVFISYLMENVSRELYDFHLDQWTATHPDNATLTKQDSLEPAKIRPFGKWFEAHFGDTIIQHVSYGGLFTVDRRDILQYPKSYYENLMQELNTHPNPEAGHYFERAWEAVFYPMNHTVFLQDETNFL